mgnify:CR=1 FL=1
MVGVGSGDVAAVGPAGARLLTEAVRVRGWATSSAVPCLRGGGRGRCATRARSWRIRRCARPWEAVACRTSRRGARRRSSGLLPPTPRSHGWWGPWPTASRPSRPPRPGPQDSETAGVGPGRRALTGRRRLGGPAAGDRHRHHSGGRPLGEIEDTAPTLQEGAR